MAIPVDRSGVSGWVRFDGPDRIAAGASGVWIATFRAGLMGVPAGGALAFVRRWPSDWDVPQCDDPLAVGFTSVETVPAVVFRWRTRRSIEWHPFDHVFELQFLDALPAGAEIVVRFGDRRGGGPGLRAQTFIEEASPIAIRLRLGREDWVELARPVVEVVGGAPARAEFVAPTDVAIGEPFETVCRIEDAWGNPADLADAPEATLEGATRIDGAVPAIWRVRLTRPGVHRLVGTGAGLAARSNPILVHAAAPDARLRWGDIHAQCVIGCGARTIDAFFTHAREAARLDFASHQANCFLVSGSEWAETERITAEHNRPGAFVTLLGLEWSADTARGGDRNLYFHGDQAPITRCSHEYVEDKSDVATDLPDADALHTHYRGTETLVAFHVGGRTTDLARHDPTTERLIEVHSTHATSEWFLFEALDRGYRLGVTAGSDGVDGRPGSSHPGHQAVRNCRGGLVAVPLVDLSRDALWNALWARNCYATSGARIRLSVMADGWPMGAEFTAERAPAVSVDIAGTAPLEAVEIFRGTKRIYEAPLVAADPTPSDRLRIGWRGATAPGNFSRARMRWDGFAALSAGRFLDVEEWALDTPDEGIVAWTSDRIDWRSMTGGDWDGIVARVDAPADAILSIHTPQIAMQLALGSLADRPVYQADTRPHRELDVRWLPRQPAPEDWSGRFTDPAPFPGWNAYWVRVRQSDGHFAWSSPIFVELPDTTAAGEESSS